MEAADEEGAGLVESRAPTLGKRERGILNYCVERHSREETFR
jgi:hypothetical protein